jgi:hypothetical protein
MWELLVEFFAPLLLEIDNLIRAKCSAELDQTTSNDAAEQYRNRRNALTNPHIRRRRDYAQQTDTVVYLPLTDASICGIISAARHIQRFSGY